MKEKFINLVKERNASGELFIVKNRRFSVSFENNKFKSVEEGNIEGFAVRVRKNGKIGFSFSESKKGIEEVVQSAFEVLDYGDEAEFDFATHTKLPNVRCFDEEILKEGTDVAIEKGKEFIDYIRSLKDGIKASFSFNRDFITQEIITTRGFQGKFDKTVKTISASGFYAEEGNFLEVYASQSRSLNETFDTEVLKEKIRTSILASERTARIGSGKHPVIFTPFAADSLLMPLLSALNGKNVLKGYSLLKGKLSQQVFSSTLTVIDNPILSGGAYSAPFDDEGIPSSRKELIAKGVPLNFLSDLYTSSKLKIAPGNASRAISSPPAPSSSNIVIRPGDVPLKDMLNIKKGLLVESLMGVMMGNILGGEVNGNVELGFLIENGKIVGRVKNTMISLNIFDAFKDITLSKENIWTERFISPYFFVPNVSVSSK